MAKSHSIGTSADPHGIEARIKALGIKKAQLARVAGVDHQRLDALIKPTNTGRVPSSYVLAPVMRALDALEARARGETAPTGAMLEIHGATRPHAAIEGQVLVFPTAANKDGSLRIVEEAQRYVAAPPAVEKIAQAFGLILRSSDMAPMFRAGDTVILNPVGVPQPGSGVVLLGEQMKALAREYVDENDTQWIVRRYGREPGEERIEKREFERLSTVVAVYPGR